MKTLLKALGITPKAKALNKRVQTLPGTKVPYRNDAQRLGQYPLPK